VKLSTKGRYSVRAMLDLAVHFGQGAIPIKDISKRQQIWHDIWSSYSSLSGEPG